LGWPTTCNNFILHSFKKKVPFFFDLFFSNPFYKPTNPILGPATLFLFPFLHFWWAQHSSVKCL
jgi:hypothetical protein